MAYKSAEFLVAVLASTALVLSPVTAQAGGVTHYGNTPHAPAPPCPPSHPNVPNRSITINRTNTINNTLNVYKPVTITNNIDNSKNISIYKPITVTTNIDNSKNITINKNVDNSKYIEINKNIDNSKYIDNSKNIIINKNININKGNSEAEAVALAAAVAAAAAASSSNSSATINFNGSSSSSANASSTASAMSSNFSNAATFNGGSGMGVGSYVAEAPGFVGGGDINVNVSAAEVAPTCTYQAATVIKAIHAICVSDDHHEFPASHMVGDTWINAGYEGEIARCLPGSSLKVTVGSVTQSSEGAAVSNAHGETMICAPHEALRHYKNGMLKCAPAEKVVDCTERTNLRKWGTGDMFFSYIAQVCLETGREYVGEQSRQNDGATATSGRSSSAY